MKTILVKFSDERNKLYSIKTAIVQNEITMEKYVIKKNIFPEGKEHIQNIYNNAEILKTAYPEVRVDPVKLTEDEELIFEYIEGESLEDKYRACFVDGDKEKMQELLKIHQQLLYGNPGNHCKYEITEGYKQFFGIEYCPECAYSLKISNFDATASNIIYQNGIPVFIDYEWVFQFPIPVELVIYHCIRDVYYHIEGLEQFYPLNEAMDFLGIKADMEILEKAYRNFHAHVIQNDDGESFGASKALNLKGLNDFETIIRESRQARQGWEQCAKELLDTSAALQFAEKNWREACQANAVSNQIIQKLQKEQSELQARVLEQQQQIEVWRQAYETVVNSKTWRLAGKLKRIVRKK